QTLGTLLTLLQHDDTLQRAIKIAFPHDWKWLIGQLPSQLEPIVALRNPGAHSERLSRDQTAEIRAMVLGIGCEGLMVQVARVRLRMAS
ncbi:MAG: hypothetical protein WEF86_02045, partial [Gemmatimonadota bacterium]